MLAKYWLFEYMTPSSMKLHNCFVMIRSKTLERISNNEIGRKFLLIKGISVFGIGHILPEKWNVQWNH